MHKKSTLILLISITISLWANNTLGKSKYTIKWTEKNNKIINNSVCHNYKEGSVENRKCRAEAKTYFINQCKNFTEKYQNTKSPYNKKYLKPKEKFCYAKRNFNIVN